MQVQRDIREGHALTLERVLAWLDEGGGVKGKTVCDAGCGTGSLAIPLALRGAAVTATDISAAMAAEAAQRYEVAAAEPGATRPAVAPTFAACCLEDVTGNYDQVCCIDVLIHYPQAQVDGMLRRLAARANPDGGKLLVSFAPSTPYYEVRGGGGGVVVAPPLPTPCLPPPPTCPPTPRRS